MEEKISALLSDGKKTKPVSFRVPQILLDRLLIAYRKKVGAIKDRGLTTNALLYFAARGVIDYEDQHREDSQKKRDGKPSYDR